jgi:hypothetical protein
VVWSWASTGGKGLKPVDMYQQEHNELFKSIRSGGVINDGDWMVNSCMMGVLGRMAAWSGQQVTWEQAINSKETLFPADLKLGDLPMPTERKPGQYKLS